MYISILIYTCIVTIVCIYIYIHREFVYSSLAAWRFPKGEAFGTQSPDLQMIMIIRRKRTIMIIIMLITITPIVTIRMIIIITIIIIPIPIMTIAVTIIDIRTTLTPSGDAGNRSRSPHSCFHFSPCPPVYLVGESRGIAARLVQGKVHSVSSLQVG